MSETKPFGDWVVRVEHPGHRRCQAEVVLIGASGPRRQCSRSGLYGWGSEMFCWQHHPDWHQWLAESRRLQAIADALWAALSR